MGFKCGIVGLPNVGKSTLFNALTRTAAAQVANYPFATIEPNTGEVAVPDPRLDTIAAIVKPAPIVPTKIGFVDIAGLVRGASKGEGLGNQFLANIREVDAIVHVVALLRGQRHHPCRGPRRPARRRRDGQHRTDARRPREPRAPRRAAPQEGRRRRQGGEGRGGADGRGAGAPRRRQAGAARAKCPRARRPRSARSTCSRRSRSSTSPMSRRMPPRPATAIRKPSRQWRRPRAPASVTISAAIEAEVALLPDAEEHEFLATLGLTEPGLDRLIRAGYDLLGLITFFTAGPKEVRAWTIPRGARAPQAAGVIHTRFREGLHPRADHRL